MIIEEDDLPGYHMAVPSRKELSAWDGYTTIKLDEPSRWSSYAQQHPEKIRAAQAKHRATLLGKASRKRYESSAKGKAAREAWLKSPSGQAYTARCLAKKAAQYKAKKATLRQGPSDAGP